jgi:glutathione peroxidase
MKTLILIISLAIGTFTLYKSDIKNTTTFNTKEMKPTSFYDIKIKGIDGKNMDLSIYKGKKIMIVNVASECGYTPQYEQLEQLYKDNVKNLIIIGCPSNDFGGQEPGTNEQIVSFCKKNYGVTFPLTDKVGITKNTHELYQWLTQKTKNGVSDNEVKWNFTKFLIDENGHLYKCFPSGVTPMDDQITKWIKS